MGRFARTIPLTRIGRPVKERGHSCPQPRGLRWLAAVILILGLFLLPSARAQRLSGGTNFKVAENFPTPHETQMKSLLEGAKGSLLENGLVLITDLTLHTYRETGQPELLVKAPECFYDQKSEAAFSPGLLRVETADGKFTIEGEGFRWSKTNSSLFISNAVHTVVAPDLFQAGGTSGGGGSAAGTGPLELFSDQFEYRADAGMAVYRGNVSVTGSNALAVSGGELQLKLPAAERRLESLTVERQVEVYYEGIRGTGQKAVYAVDTGQVRVTGDPAWRADQREGGGQELLIDRTNRFLRATGQAWLKLPGQSLAAMNFLPGETSSTNAAAGGSRVLQVFSDRYEFHTNFAVFHDRVRVVQVESAHPKATLNCGLMTALFGQTNDLRTLTAEQDVVMEQQTESGEKVTLSGRQAEYVAATGLMTLVGNPRWQAGAREGKGTLIQVNAAQKEMLVRGNASMRLPAEELRTAAGGGGKPGTAAGLSPEFAEITCDQYRLRPEQGLFQGGVRMRHPQTDLTCSEVTVDFPPHGGQVQRIVADEAVAFNLHDDKGQVTHGTGDKAVYSFSVEGGVTNDLVRLTGAPAVIWSTNNAGRSRFANDVILLDRAHNNRIMTPGKFSLRMVQTGTNVLKLPNFK